MRVSHLQYADDMIFLGTTNPKNDVAMKRILKNFELVSGLKVNFNKSCLMGLNIEWERLESMANSLGCDVRTFLFFILGCKSGRQP